MRTRPHRVAHERPTGLAGWLYADIFLALMVVGLATVTVRGSADEAAAATTTTTTTTTTAVPVPGQTTTTTTTTTPPSQLPRFLGEKGPKGSFKKRKYDKSTIENLDSDIDAFLQQQGWNQGAVVVVANVLGPYDPSSEDSNVGTGRAKNFEEVIRFSDPAHFEESTRFIVASRQGGTSTYEITLYFAYLGGGTA